MGFDKQYDSKEEVMFSYYVNELIDKGWLVGAEYHPHPVSVTDEHKVHAYTRSGERNIMTYVTLAKKHEYTYDWKLYWSDKAHGVFFWKEGGVYEKGFYPYSKPKNENYLPFYASQNVSLVDIKGGFIGRNNTSAITFPINQKVLLSRGMFVQKIVISLDEKGLFYRTFTPRQVVIDEVYKKDAGTHKAGDSKLKYQPRLLEQWTRNK
jgi:hypothetical protein